MKLGMLALSLVLASACAASRKPEASTDSFVREARRDGALAAVAGTEMRVSLEQDLGPAQSPPGKLFTARLLAPVLDARGQVLVPVGAKVHGHVVAIDESQRRIELSFDRLEMRDGVYRIRATVIGAQPYAYTVAPSVERTAETTVTLQAMTPNAIGGGPPVPPSEPAQPSEPGAMGTATQPSAILPFDAELRLRLLGPLDKVEQ